MTIKVAKLEGSRAIKPSNLVVEFKGPKKGTTFYIATTTHKEPRSCSENEILPASDIVTYMYGTPVA